MTPLPEGSRRLRLEGQAGEMTRLARWTAALLEEVRAGERDRFRVDLVLSEVVANVAEHAFAPGVAYSLGLEVTHDHGVLRFIVTDDGRAFDPLSAPVPPPAARLEDATPGGRGLILIRQYCDETAYRRTGERNELTLGFRLEHVAGRPPALDAALCRSHRLLQTLTPEALAELLRHCEQREIAAGEVLLEPGRENHTLYFLLRGRLQVHLPGDHGGQALFIEAGEITGEMSIIEREKVLARVTADTPSTVLAMPEHAFWDQYCSRPSQIPALLQGLVARMRRTTAVLQEEYVRRVRYEHLQRELEGAARIQAGVLPVHQPLFESPLVDVQPCFRPARTVGGDFYDAIALNRHRLAVAIGDVSGKGMPAALFMMRTVSLLRMILLRHRDPARVLPDLNRQLCHANDECMFVTLAVLILDTDTGVVTYLNAGHNPVLVARAGEPFSVWDAPPGVLLGVNEQATFTPSKRKLAPQDTLVLYTDGVTEAENADQAQFGLERTLAALARPEDRSSAARLIGALEDAVAAFVHDAPQSDDITALALIYRGALLPDGTPWPGRNTRQPSAGRGSSTPPR